MNAREAPAHPRADDEDVSLDARRAAIDWPRVERELDADGAAVIEALLPHATCAALAALYAEDARFRSKVVMARHGYGRGEYKYFAYPLPATIARLRGAIYPRLAPIANRWNEAMGIAVRYPARHAEYIERCHAAGQTKPTPLLLSYAAGDYNCLHQRMRLVDAEERAQLAMRFDAREEMPRQLGARHLLRGQRARKLRDRARVQVRGAHDAPKTLRVGPPRGVSAAAPCPPARARTAPTRFASRGRRERPRVGARGRLPSGRAALIR